MASIGSHCILELFGCPATILNDKASVTAAIRNAARESDSTLITEVSHRFAPQGVTALGLLAESHISIHTWPEQGYAACDVFTCGEQAKPEQACHTLARALKCERYELRRIPRGMNVEATRPPRLPVAGEVA